MKRRVKIRIISFSVIFVFVCMAFGISSTVKMRNYKIQMNIAQQRALTELTENLNSMETSLTKSMYVNSGKMLSGITEELVKLSSGAKTSLSALYSGETQLYNIYKFLSQVSDYTSSLNKKAARGESITDEERRTLKQLLEYSSSLSRQFSYISELLSSGYLSFEELDEKLISADESSESTVSFMSAASDAEDSMTDYPSLIYDGPFSDNILDKTSALLESSEEISQTEAMEKAAVYFGTTKENIYYEDETQGKMGAYIFRRGDSRIAVTVMGGYLAYMLTDYTAGQEKLTSSDCIEKASAYLYACGYKKMKSTYCSSYDGVCTVNFAYLQNGYICYPDLIKVSVSLTDGTVVSVDASDYIMNHIYRDIPEEKISFEEAKKAVADTLSVKDGYYAVIPTSSGGENFTYELLCEDKDGKDVLVYIDTVSGEEDDILLLLYSDNGTLTE